MGKFRNIISSKKWDEEQDNSEEQSIRDDSTNQIEHEMEVIDTSNKPVAYSIDEKQDNLKKKSGLMLDGTIGDINSITNSLTRSQIASHEQGGDDEEEEAHYEDKHVRRALKQRHIGMIALGGTIGTGLFVGISTPLSNAGPVGSLIAYIFMGTVVYFVTQSLGEMATFIP